jgi:hypothetical protein
MGISDWFGGGKARQQKPRASHLEIIGPIFDEAKKKSKAAGPQLEYTATAIPATDDYFFAVFALPGSTLKFVYDDRGEAAVFRDREAAEHEARKWLVNELNARLRGED